MRVNHQKTHWKGSVTQHQELHAPPGAPGEKGVGDLLGRAAETTHILQTKLSIWTFSYFFLFIYANSFIQLLCGVVFY